MRGARPHGRCAPPPPSVAELWPLPPRCRPGVLSSISRCACAHPVTVPLRVHSHAPAPQCKPPTGAAPALLIVRVEAAGSAHLAAVPLLPLSRLQVDSLEKALNDHLEGLKLTYTAYLNKCVPVTCCGVGQQATCLLFCSPHKPSPGSPAGVSAQRSSPHAAPPHAGCDRSTTSTAAPPWMAGTECHRTPSPFSSASTMRGRRSPCSAAAPPTPQEQPPWARRTGALPPPGQPLSHSTLHAMRARSFTAWACHCAPLPAGSQRLLGGWMPLRTTDPSLLVRR